MHRPGDTCPDDILLHEKFKVWTPRTLSQRVGTSDFWRTTQGCATATVYTIIVCCCLLLNFWNLHDISFYDIVRILMVDSGFRLGRLPMSTDILSSKREVHRVAV